MYPGIHARSQPDKPAVIMSSTGQITTYQQLDDCSRRLAHVLAEAGMGPGDHIALLTNNRPEAYEVYWAALRSGLYITAVNSHLSADEASYIVRDCEAQALIASADLVTAEAVAALAPALKVRLSFGGAIPGFDGYEEALAGASDGPLAAEPRGADMLYSSGTTGQPKGIRSPLSGRSITDPDPFVTFLGTTFGVEADTVYLSPAPVYHAAPLRFAGVVHSWGGTVVMMERFDPLGALAAIEAHRVTHSQWVPTMFIRMLKLDAADQNARDLSSHRVAIHAAAPCPVDVKQAMIAWWGPILVEYYSSTEGNGLTAIDSTEWLARPGSVGRSRLGVIRICDDAGVVLDPGQIGTVYFERDTVPFEYHNDEGKSISARHPEHPTWTTTGDIGYVDADGYLFLTDRKAFMIISGGVNIYPQEIEDVLALHPKVADVAVIGIPDPEMGERVHAVVQPALDAVPGEELAEEILNYLRERIARYKVPRAVDFISELPRTPTGKLVKGPLRDRYIEIAREHPEA